MTLELVPKPPEPPPPTGSEARGDPGGEHNLIARWLDYTNALPSPPQFRLWTAIHAIGAAAERRLWTQFGMLSMHPNLFVFLVGPPGVGKTVSINRMVGLLRKSQAVAVAPNDVTKQGLLDALAEAGKGTILDGIPFDYHFLALSISELANFMGKYDIELTGLLTDLYDCPAANEEKKRTHDKGMMIPFPGISFIIGTATQNLGNTVSDIMWGSGFMARVILIYSSEEIVPEDMFEQRADDKATADAIVLGLRKIGDMKGPFHWTPEARLLFNTFRKEARETAPIHNRLGAYYTRRWAHLAKLCMICALSDLRQTITAWDYTTALGWLVSAEEVMPEVFKDMVSHEDGQIYEEMKQAMALVQMKRGKPIFAYEIKAWLAPRVASHKVNQIFDVAMAADHFRRVGGTTGDSAQFVVQMGKGPSPGAV